MFTWLNISLDSQQELQAGKSEFEALIKYDPVYLGGN
jgi:hypothetical protein